jgi:hypothetical protein
VKRQRIKPEHMPDLECRLCNLTAENLEKQICNMARSAINLVRRHNLLAHTVFDVAISARRRRNIGTKDKEQPR